MKEGKGGGEPARKRHDRVQPGQPLTGLKLVPGQRTHIGTEKKKKPKDKKEVRGGLGTRSKSFPRPKASTGVKKTAGCRWRKVLVRQKKRLSGPSHHSGNSGGTPTVQIMQEKNTQKRSTKKRIQAVSKVGRAPFRWGVSNKQLAYKEFIKNCSNRELGPSKTKRKKGGVFYMNP